VHVRQTDRAIPTRHFHRALAPMLARMPGAAIFLTTDNRAVEDEFRARYGNIITTEKWLPTAGEQLHYNKANADLTRSAVEALKDILLLSRTNALVYAGSSTFSYLARCIAGFAEADAVDVERFDVVVNAKRIIQSLM
jgi:hypothetical protein